jgi:hypothetical protein
MLGIGAMLMAACGGAPPQPTMQANVRLHSQLDSDSSQYRVEGAAGATEGAAKKSAATQALIYAAKELTGDPKQKTNAGEYVKSHLLEIMPMSTAGKIIKRGFTPDGSQTTLNLFIKINVTQMHKEVDSIGDMINRASAANAELRLELDTKRRTRALEMIAEELSLKPVRSLSAPAWRGGGGLESGGGSR